MESRGVERFFRLEASPEPKQRSSVAYVSIRRPQVGEGLKRTSGREQQVNITSVDGDATRSCVTAMSDANGKSITTIEGLDPEGNHPVQKAWRAVNVPQCGYCQAGQIMQAAALLKQTPHPTDADIDSGMYGNICRCGTYHRIRAAIKQAAGA
jgi:aerobic-type carbon monoxide dehydrogenase small subunit (CoxS/CutS family)